MLPSWSRYVRAAGSQWRSVSSIDSTSCSSSRSLVPSSSASSTGWPPPAASLTTSLLRERCTVLRAPPSSTVRSRPAGWMNRPPAGTCRERLSFPWPRRTVTGPSRCRITRWVSAAAKDSRYGRSRCTDRYCLSHPRPALVRSGLIHGCRRMPLVSRGPSSLVTRPSLMPIRCRLTPRSLSSVVAGEEVRGPLLPTLGAFGRSSFTREHLVVVTVLLTHVLVEHHAQNESEWVISSARGSWAMRRVAPGLSRRTLDQDSPGCTAVVTRAGAAVLAHWRPSASHLIGERVGNDGVAFGGVVAQDAVARPDPPHVRRSPPWRRRGPASWTVHGVRGPGRAAGGPSARRPRRRQRRRPTAAAARWSRRAAPTPGRVSRGHHPAGHSCRSRR